MFDGVGRIVHREATFVKNIAYLIPLLGNQLHHCKYASQTRLFELGLMEEQQLRAG